MCKPTLHLGPQGADASQLDSRGNRLGLEHVDTSGVEPDPARGGIVKVDEARHLDAGGA